MTLSWDGIKFIELTHYFFQINSDIVYMDSLTAQNLHP